MGKEWSETFTFQADMIFKKIDEQQNMKLQ
jgi:hypothetical protein